MRGCKYSGEADLVPFQSPKLPFSSEKLLRPRLRQGLDCSEGDGGTVGEVFGKRSGPHFPLTGQGGEDWECLRGSVILCWPPWWTTPAVDFSQTSVLALGAVPHRPGPPSSPWGNSN